MRGIKVLVVTLLASFAFSEPVAEVTSKVWFDIEIDGEYVGYIIIGLFGKEVPWTAENFKEICTGERGNGPNTGWPMHYKDNWFHRIIPGFMAQGGDFSDGDGRGGESIYGLYMNDENFNIPLSKAGLLAMANSGPNTNGS